MMIYIFNMSGSMFSGSLCAAARDDCITACTSRIRRDVCAALAGLAHLSCCLDQTNESRNGKMGQLVEYNKLLGRTYTSCPRHRALLLVAGTLAALVFIALVAALARPVSRCPPVARPEESTPGWSLRPTPPPANPWPHVRLPDFAQPVHYALVLHPNLTTATSFGFVNVSLQFVRSSDFIIVHAKNLSFLQVGLHNALTVQVKGLRYVPLHDQVYIQLNESVPAGNQVILHIAFSGTLDRDLVGLYLSSYVTAANETRRLAATQFEPTSARRAFPCLDEPALKASFELELVHEQSHQAYANARRQSLRPFGGQLVSSRFERSLRMSTYLVAFVICDYEALTSQLGAVQLRVLVPKEQSAQGHFALTMMKRSLDFFDDFFSIPYPMSKLDLVGVPDFGPGAMENWGLVTFRMSSLLYDEAVTPVRSQERVASTVVHEIAHQWFGNLVTMRWWDDLWLNEGLATFLEVVCLQQLQPEWRLAELFPYSTTQPALELDSLDTSHPVSASVRDPADIDALFDTISYNKGAALVAMLEGFLGRQQLRKGLTQYLNMYRYHNADTADLWDTFTNVTSGQVGVSQVMETWTRQKGFPLVRLSVGSDGWLHATQRRFQLLPADLVTDVARWHVPLTFVMDGGQQHLVWMNSTDLDVSLGESVPSWIKANVNQTGFYRVNYDAPNWAALMGQLQRDHQALWPADRASLLDDAFTLARAGELNLSVALELASYLKKERDFGPWATALPHLLDLQRMGSDSDWLPVLQGHLLSLLRPVLADLGWEDTGPHLDRKLRAEILHAALELEDEQVLQEASHHFGQWMYGQRSLGANLKDVVYRAGVRQGGRRAWQHCWQHYLSSQVPSEKALLLQALGASPSQWQLQHFKETTFSLDSILSALLPRFHTEYDYQEVKQFFGQVELQSGRLALDQALERIRSNIFWFEHVEPQLRQWLLPTT
ncbi:endoplasmic reticulum aminopeptidase 1-like isoform X2 [Dermacentor variabilis]|uniref:endoplasmic reticulum aminopeptidase 1-like isoform X2 n=1 Tax=Dermacentor variabilis TaxID=34621 RepID=UPI003F5CA68B